MITQEISHIFRVRQRWNRQNRSILTILNLRLTFLRFHEKRVISPYVLFFIPEKSQEALMDVNNVKPGVLKLMRHSVIIHCIFVTSFQILLHKSIQNILEYK